MNKQELQNEISKTKQRLANMEKMLAECEHERWKPKENEGYYYINHSGELGLTANNYTSFDESVVNAYNCFQTREQAKQEAEKILVRRMLEDIARRLNKGEKIDYKKTQCQYKYFIFWDAELDELKQRFLCWTKTQGVVYCLDRSFLEVAIQEIGEERLKRYLRGE